jgi:hypothetical protein
LLLALLSWGSAQDAPKFSVTSSLQSSYVQGAADAVSIFVKLNEATNALEQGVIFLNVVEATPSYPQAAHKIFASASEEPKIFQVVYSADSLLQGLGTTLSFQLKADAKPATYSLVIQVFNDGNTDPHRVKAENRVAIKSFSFEIVKP